MLPDSGHVNPPACRAINVLLHNFQHFPQEHRILAHNWANCDMTTSDPHHRRQAGTTYRLCCSQLHPSGSSSRRTMTRNTGADYTAPDPNTTVHQSSPSTYAHCHTYLHRSIPRASSPQAPPAIHTHHPRPQLTGRIVADQPPLIITSDKRSYLYLELRAHTWRKQRLLACKARWTMRKHARTLHTQSQSASSSIRVNEVYARRDHVSVQMQGCLRMPCSAQGTVRTPGTSPHPISGSRGSRMRVRLLHLY
jgi:hypothetical protein